MVREAESNAADDARKREEIESHNNLDGLIYQVEKFLRENAEKIPGDIKAEVEAKLPDAKSALEARETSRMQTAFRELSDAFQKVGPAMYSEDGAGGGAEAPAGAGAGAESTAPEGDVVDAEFKEV